MITESSQPTAARQPTFQLEGKPRRAAAELAASAAFGDRQPWRTRLARATSKSVRVARRLMRRRHQAVLQGRSFRFVPTPASREELADLIGRFNWYLADLATEVRIAGIASSNLDLCPEDAPHLDPGLLTRPPMLVDDHDGPAHLLIHRVTPGSLFAMAKARGAASIVDARFHGLDDSFEYFELRRRLLDSRPLLEHGHAMERLFNLSSSRGTALVVGTGPGAREVLSQHIDHEIRVICNSAIRDEAILEHVQPNVIAFSDHVFHLGPSRYAAAFREDVMRLAARTDCLFVVPDFGAELLLVRHPELAGRVIGLQVGPWDSEWRTLSRENTCVRETGNVLTKYMLPVALGLADRVDVAGCDGRKPGEKYFWSHGRTVQYSDELMRSVFEAHLSFFRDNDYEDYYGRHCTLLEGIIGWAEAAGKVVRCVTPSHIPALATRVRA